MRTFAYKSFLMALIVTALREIGEGNVTEAQMAVIQDQLKNIPAEEITTFPLPHSWFANN